MSDLIDRQEALDALERSKKTYFDRQVIIGAMKDIVRNLPSAQPETHDERTETHACDLISRAMLLDYIHNEPIGKMLCDRYNLDGVIKQLPSAQPERKRGKWIYNSPVTMKCDQCGLVIKDWDWHRFKFCPNCDCDMRGEENG